MYPKTDIETWKKINNTINDFISSCLKGHWRDLHMKHVFIPIIDGDRLQKNGLPFSPECKGHYIINTRSPEFPEIVDKEMRPIIDLRNLQEGAYARVSLQFTSNVKNDKPGVDILFGAIMKMADGDPMQKNQSLSASELFSGFAEVVNSQEKQEPVDIEPPQTEKQEDSTPQWQSDEFRELAETVKTRPVKLDEVKELTQP